MEESNVLNERTEKEQGNNDLEDLVSVQFVKMFETRQKKGTDNEQELIDQEELDFDACVVCWVPELFFCFPSHILIFQCSKVTNETFPAKPLAKNDWPAYIRRPKLK